MPVIRCKVYHQPRSKAEAGTISNDPTRKSRCPAWADNFELQRRLIEDALVESDGPEDSYGRPKNLWNAVAGTVFIGVSTNEQEPAYNCYPTVAVTSLRSALSKRAERTVAELLAAGAE